MTDTDLDYTQHRRGAADPRGIKSFILQNNGTKNSLHRNGTEYFYVHLLLRPKDIVFVCLQKMITRGECPYMNLIFFKCVLDNFFSLAKLFSIHDDSLVACDLLNSVAFYNSFCHFHAILQFYLFH